MTVETIKSGDWGGFEEALVALLSTPQVVVGVAVPDKVHPAIRRGGNGSSVTYRQIAFINEYGDDGKNIPERPVFGPALAEHEGEYMDAIQTALKDAMFRGRPWRESLDDLADLMVQHVQDNIDDYSDQVPLATSTVRRKRALGVPNPEQPWIEGGALYDALEGVINIQATSFSEGARRFRGANGRFIALGAVK